MGQVEEEGREEERESILVVEASPKTKEGVGVDRKLSGEV